MKGLAQKYQETLIWIFMELFAHKFVANRERKTYLRLSGRSNFLNISTKAVDNSTIIISAYIFFVLLGTMMSQIKPLWKEHGIGCCEGTAISREILPSRVLRIANLELTENTALMLKMDPEKSEEDIRLFCNFFIINLVLKVAKLMTNHVPKGYLISSLNLLASVSSVRETCIKRTPSIKRTEAKVPKFFSLIYFKWNLC